MRKLSKKEIESELIFIKRNLEYENMNVSKKTLKRCRRILEGKLDPEKAMEEIRINLFYPSLSKGSPIRCKNSQKTEVNDESNQKNNQNTKRS